LPGCAIDHIGTNIPLLKKTIPTLVRDATLF
jgi:hypothetical protein